MKNCDVITSGPTWEMGQIRQRRTLAFWKSWHSCSSLSIEWLPWFSFSWATTFDIFQVFLEERLIITEQKLMWGCIGRKKLKSVSFTARIKFSVIFCTHSSLLTLPSDRWVRSKRRATYESRMRRQEGAAAAANLWSATRSPQAGCWEEIESLETYWVTYRLG